MNHPTASQKNVAAQIAALEDLNWNELKAKWTYLFGREPGINNRRYVERRLIHRIQEDAARQINPALLTDNERRIRQLIKTGTLRPRKIKSLVAGSVLTRNYRGALHSVRVLADGRFEYLGQHYGSLSIIARLITGTRWSGPAFFGLGQSTQKKDLAK